MTSQKVVVDNVTGLHLGPAGKLCDLAMQFKSHIVFHYRNNGEANAKSMLSVLGAGIRQGDEIEIVCDGEDEQEALQALVQLVQNHFEEDR